MKKISWNNYNFSKLCLGTVQFGIDYGIANQTGKIANIEVNKILQYVVNQEINCFDTGSMYGDSEKKIGNFIKDSKNSDIYIISKIKKDFFDLNYDISMKDIDNSLQDLEINTLFALLLHNIEPIQNWNTKYENIVNTLKVQKRIKYFGVSIYTDEEFNLALNNKQVDIIQIPFNLLDQRAIKLNWLKKAKEKNKLIFIRSIYLQGLILMSEEAIPPYLQNAKKYITIIEDIANRLNISKNQLALSFVNQIANDSILLFGCDNLKQAKENIENYNNLLKLDNDTLNYLKKSFSDVSGNIYNPMRWNKK